MTVNYNRQINKKIVFFGFISYMDFFAVTPIVGGGFATGSTELVVFGLAAYLFYGLVFRVGRPPGYGKHFFVGRYLTCTSFRAGHISPVYPFPLPVEGESPSAPAAK